MQTYQIGIDEVGRGCLAGPITVVALALSKKLRFKNPLKDSKKLSPSQRDAWFAYIKNEESIFYAVAHVQPSVIDRINISKSANLAATRAFEKLSTMQQLDRTRVLLDGGLYLNNPALNVRPKTIIRGDEKYNVIKLASIVAKVYRDRLMARKDKQWPDYAFYRHKGYGTELHRKALKKRGPVNIHRLTFIDKIIKMS